MVQYFEPQPNELEPDTERVSVLSHVRERLSGVPSKMHTSMVDNWGLRLSLSVRQDGSLFAWHLGKFDSILTKGFDGPFLG